MQNPSRPMDSKFIERIDYGVVGLVILIAFMLARKPGARETVWVPGENFEIALTISITNPNEPYAVNEWIDLYAEQRSGPWVEVASDAKPVGVQHWNSPPPEIETKVQGSVHWIATPSENVEFNLPTASDLDVRRIRFAKPGTYTLRAEINGPEANIDRPVKSNELTINVQE